MNGVSWRFELKSYRCELQCRGVFALAHFIADVWTHRLRILWYVVVVLFLRARLTLM